MATNVAPLLRKLSKRQALVLRKDGTIKVQDDGPWRSNIDELQQLIGCRSFQMIPCTQGWMAHKFELWMDESGACVPNNLNATASEAFGEQVYGGVLHGCVLAVRSGTIE